MIKSGSPKASTCSKNPSSKMERASLLRSACLVAPPLIAVALVVTAAILNALYPFSLPSPRKGACTVVAARDGTPLRAFADENGVWRHPVSVESVSPLYLEALINYEDRYFYRHPGVNPFALARAAWQWVLNGRIVSGGSTLTMQVARLVEPQSKTVEGKARQMFRALQLEWNHSKTEILAYYLNHAPFGGTVEGVQAACYTYLGKSSRELSHAEAALMAVLPQAPTRLRPDRHPSRATTARNKVLDRMASLQAWPKQTVEQAEIETVPSQYNASPMSAPLLARRLKDRIEPGADRPTTIDFHLQNTLEQRLADFASELPKRTSLAILVVENANLAVRAYVGSVDFSDSERFGHVDMVRAIRSPGSTLKPFLYGFALEDGLIHSQSMLADAPVSFGGYRPGNFTGGYAGPVSAEEALQRSLNVPAVQLLERLAPEAFHARLRRGGLRLRLPGAARPNLSVILGGAGASLESLTETFTCFARKGLSGKLRFFEDEPLKDRYVTSESAAWVVRHILETNPSRTRHNDLFDIPEYRKIAWKTGTSYGFRDAWAIGVNDSHTAGVWVGRPDGTPVPGHYGAITAAPLLFAIFDSLPTETPGTESRRPENVREMDICWPLGVPADTLAQGLCHVRKTAWVIDGVVPPTLPDRNANSWESPILTFWIDSETGHRILPGCPAEHGKKVEMPRWPLALEPWLPPEIRRKTQPPPVDPSCALVSAPRSGALKLAGLASGNILRRAGENGDAPRVDLSVLGAKETVYWLINGELKRTTSPKEVFAHRFHTPGEYEITVLDANGNFDRVEIVVTN